MALWPRLFGRDAPTPPPTAAPRRPRVFVSYAHQPPDLAALVREFAQYLTRCGFDVWFDELDIHAGDAWRRAIVDGLRTTDWTLAFLSAHAMRTGSVCLDEIALSMHQRPGSLVTVLLEPAKTVPVPVSIAGVQWLDLSGWRTAQAQSRRAWDAWRDARFADIRALLSDHHARQATGEIAELASRLRPLPQASLIGRLVDRFVGREWLADAINDWRLNRPAERMLLLTGAAGIGKSAFAAWLTHFARPNVFGLTISRADDPPSRTPANVLRTLTFQIATRLPDYRRNLLDLLAQRDPDDRPVHDVHAMEPVPLFRLLLANPLRLIDGGRTRDRLLLVVDGLDETLETDRCPLADLFAQHAAELPDWMCVLLTSRPHHEIERALSQLVPLRIETQAANNIADIRDYAERWLDSLDPPVPDWDATLRRLIEAAGGSFQYLTVLRQEVEQRRVSLREPAALPQGLVGLYRVWMDRQFPDRATYDEWRALLAVLCAAHGPVPEAFLAELLGWDPQRRAHMLEQIEGLFERRDGAVAPCHASLRTWLTTEEAARSDFWVQVAHGRQLLADALWERFAAWLDQPDASLDLFLLAELPTQLVVEDISTVRNRLTGSVRWERLADGLKSILACRLPFDRVMAISWLRLAGHFAEAIGHDGLALYAWAWISQGEIFFVLGDSQEANNSYHKGLAALESLATCDLDNMDWQHELSISHERLGEVARAQGDLTGALAWYRQCHDIREVAARNAGDAKSLEQLSVSNIAIGDVLQDLGDLAGALTAYQKSFSVRTTLVDRSSGNKNSQRALSISHQRIAQIQKKIGDLASSLASFGEALTICRRLAAIDPGAADWQAGVANNLANIGTVLEMQGDLAAAQAAHRECLNIRKTLISWDPEYLPAQFYLSITYQQLGGVLQAAGEIEDAVASYCNGLDIGKRLVAHDPSNSQWHDILAISYEKLGDLKRVEGDLIGALEAYRHNHSIRETLVDRDPSNAQWQFSLSVSHEKLGDVLRDGSDLPGALARYYHSLAIFETLARKHTDNAVWQRAPVVSHLRIGRVHFWLGQLPEARRAATTALSFARVRAERFPQAPYITQDVAEAGNLLESISQGAPAQTLSPPPPQPRQRPRELRSEARAALDAGHPDQALDLLKDAPDDGRTRNLRAVCLLRLGQPEAARDMLHPALFPNGGAEPADGTADTWVLNHATAQFLAGDPRGCRRSLGWLKNPSRGASRLRDALATWERLPHQRGAPPPKPTLPYTPGEL